jgi:hypothetical protein
MYMDESERAEVKASIVAEIAELSGESEEDVNAVVAQWSKSSNDNDMRSLALQRDAAEEFGLPLSEFTQGKISKLQDQIDHLIEKPSVGEFPDLEPLLSSDKQRRILQAMYDNTQAKLADAGFKPGDSITLYRGVNLPKTATSSWRAGDTVSITGNTMESWSLGKEVARRFANWPGAGERNTILTAKVPIESIISTARTGAGCLIEGEFIIAGSIPGDAWVESIGG